ncbi:MAG: hypothetical protein NTX23_08370 [Candidatus Bipolaricaulota bacterium]|nr:hypothetical protein [Candidatus Bipolaricaulota bacterium]
MPEFVPFTREHLESRVAELLPVGHCGTCGERVMMDARQAFRIEDKLHVGVFCPGCGEFVGVRLGVPLRRQLLCATVDAPSVEVVGPALREELDEMGKLQDGEAHLATKFERAGRDLCRFMLEASSLIVDRELSPGVRLTASGCEIDDTAERRRALFAWLWP